MHYATLYTLAQLNIKNKKTYTAVSAVGIREASVNGGRQ